MDLEEKILAQVEAEDLPEEMKYLAEQIGLDNVKKLMCAIGGSQPHIPKPTSFAKIVLEKHIKKDLKKINNPYSIRKLSRDYNVCESTVKKIIRDLRRSTS